MVITGLCPSATGEVGRAAGIDQPDLPLATAGEKNEAQQMLAEIYNWFTEGFDTKDLQEAKALLAELAEERP
jgi:predicted ATPase